MLSDSVFPDLISTLPAFSEPGHPDSSCGDDTDEPIDGSFIAPFHHRPYEDECSPITHEDAYSQVPFEDAYSQADNYGDDGE